MEGDVKVHWWKRENGVADTSGRSLVGIVGSNPARVIDVSLTSCVVQVDVSATCRSLV